MRLVLISDTHGLHGTLDVPDGDVLIHAGDFTLNGTVEEVVEFNHFLEGLPHGEKIVIAGNHDFCLQEDRRAAEKYLKGATYLEDSACTVDGVKFWGSPWQPWFMDMAFNLNDSNDLLQKWSHIPHDTDVLITHTPPGQILDLTSLGERVGCRELAKQVALVEPRLHVFGHIHEAYGVLNRGKTKYVNACTCSLQYIPNQPAIVIDI